MIFKEIAIILLEGLKERIESTPAISIFAKNRSNFEDWLKVEVCDILQEDFDEIFPENPIEDIRIDLIFGNQLSNKKGALELKTIPTEYRTEITPIKRRSIDEKKKSIVYDIEKLKKCNFDMKVVLFIVYPLAYETQFEEQQNNMEKSHLQYIQEHLKLILKEKIVFNYGDIGMIYIGLI